MYEWELQMRGVWHLHVVLGMERRSSARGRTSTWRRCRNWLSQRASAGLTGKPLRAPRPAEQAANYLSKYLAKWQPDGSLELTETVKSAGPTLLNYVSRKLTAKSGCTMRNLRIARIVWAWLSGLIEDPGLDPWDELVAVCLLDRLPVPVRGP